MNNLHARPPSQRRHVCGMGSAFGTFLTRTASALLVFALGLACSSTDAPVAPRADTPPAVEFKRYLVNPLEGYELSVGAEEAVRIDRGFSALLERGDSATALELANSLLARDDQLAPATLLQQQVAFVAGDYSSVVDRLRPVVEDAPGYGAANLLLARSYDLLGREVEAYEFYLRSDAVPARTRSEALRGPVAQQLADEFQRALAGNDLERARLVDEKLADLFPNGVETLEARRDLAFATEDFEQELIARRELALLRSPDADEQRRLANLEVDLGDPTQGLEMLQRMVDANPNDFGLREDLEAAKFTWRLNMLPPEVAAIARSPELTRGDFAALLYWVIPGARSGQPGSGRIATDIPVDHPFRKEIVRIVNLGWLELADVALRRFEPEKPMLRRDAMEALLRLPGRLDIAPACAAEYVAGGGRNDQRACVAARRCGLVEAEAACDPYATLAGLEARELARRALNLLGGTRP